MLSYKLKHNSAVHTNGQESDAEITGSFGSHYTAEHWMFDSRLVRRWENDPVVKPHESPYAAFGNNPIWFIDPNGADTTFFQEDGSYDEQAKADFTAALNKVDKTIEGLQNNIENYENSLNSNELSKREVKKTNKSLTRAKSLLTDWEKLKSDFDNIISNDAMFRYTSDASQLKSNELGAVLGGKVTRTEDGQLHKSTLITVVVRSGLLGTYIHENRHLNQKINNLSYEGFKIERETDAFNYQAIFNNKSIIKWRQIVHNNYYGDMAPKMPLIKLEKAIEIMYGE